jgi:hypothetical protein
MEHLICTARNLRFSIDDEGGVVAEIEAVLTLSGRSIPNVGAGLTSVEKTTTVRFQMCPNTARTVAANLVSWADEADELESRITVEKKKE